MCTLTILLYEICRLCQDTFGAPLQFPLIFLMKDMNSVLSSPSQTPNSLLKLFSRKQNSQATSSVTAAMRASFCSWDWQPFFFACAPACLQVSELLSAVGDCTELVDLSHGASFMSQVQRKEPLRLQPHSQVLPGGFLTKHGMQALPLELALVFLQGMRAPGNGRRKK